MKDENKTKAELIKELKISREKLGKNTLNTITKPIKTEDKYLSFTKNILDSSAVGMFILDSDFKVVWINHSIEKYFGLQREKVIGKDKRKLIKESIQRIFEDPDEFIRKVFATYDNNTYVENFECHVLPEGKRKERWLEHWSQPIKSGLYAGGRIEHYYDITERKQAENALRETSEYLENLLKYANSPIIVWNNSLMITRFNPAFEYLSGYSAGEVIGKKIDILFPKDKVEQSLQDIEETIRGKRWEIIEIEIMRKDRTVRTVLWNSANALDTNGNIIATIAQGQDITERKQAEKALAWQNQKKNTVLYSKIPVLLR